MAFNPFTSFRRHQKTIFATMAIICMLLFVLSSGVGGTDLLHQFSDWFSRGRGGKNNAAASIDGKKIDQDVVNNIMVQRKLADMFMKVVIEQSHYQILSNIRRQRDQSDAELQRLIDQYTQLEVFKTQYPPELILPSFVRLQQQARGLRLTLSLGNAANKDDQVRIVDTMVALMDRERSRINKALQQGRDSFFGGNPDKLEDTLDFMLWEKEAERLGIHFMKADVDHAVAQETMNQPLTADVNKSILQFLQDKFRGFNLGMLQSALAAEFRVRAAKTAILGESTFTKSGPPVIPTPDEMFEWYKDMRTTVKVGLIDVPVAKYVSQVTETPTDAQLKELFDKYKNEEYDPRFERPGFKEPRKVKVEWVALPNDAKFYSAVADKSAIFAAIATFGTPAVAADGGAALTMSEILSSRQVFAELPVDELYRQYLQFNPSWTSPIAFGIRSGVHDSSVLRPENIATLVGAAAGATLTESVVLGAPLTFEGRVITVENFDRARLGLTAILSGALEPAPLGIDGLITAIVPKPLSEAALRGALTARYREKLLDGLVKADRDWFMAELAKRTKDQVKVNVEAFINDFIHTRELRRGGTTEPLDRFRIADDAGIAELRTVFEKTRKDPTGEQFASRLLDSQMQPKPELFQPEIMQGERMTYLHWRSEEMDPRAVTFDVAKPKVEAAWKFEKARPLAKAAAEKLAGEAKNKTEMELRDLAAKASSEGLIELPMLARLNPTPSFGTGGSPRYDPPAIPADKVKYPGTLTKTVVDMRNDAVGATTVGLNLPKANYYVAALIKKDVPSFDAFRTVYKASMGPPNFRDNLFEYYSFEMQDKYKQELTKQLRTDARLEIFQKDKSSQDEGS